MRTIHKRSYLIVLLLSAFLGNTMEALGVELNGQSSLTGNTFDSLCSNGDLKAEKVVVHGTLETNGTLQGKSIKCRDYQGNGAFEVEGFQAQNITHHGSFIGHSVQATGNTKISGGVEVSHSTFKNLEIATDHARLVDVTLQGSVLIKKIEKNASVLQPQSHHSTGQVIELRGHTVIEGDMIFEEPGEVHMFGTSEVKGSIIKGKIITQ